MKQLRHILSVGMLIALISSASAQSWLTNGLVAYYPFNGNANDASGNGNDGIPQYLSYGNNRFGKTNGAALFGYTSGVSSYFYFGNNSQVLCPTLNTLPNYPITFTFWMNLTAYQTWLSFRGGGVMTIIGKEGSGYQDAAVSIYSDNGIATNQMAYLGSVWNNGSFSPRLKQWYHVSFSLTTNGTQTFYVNGALVSQIVSPTIFNCSTDIPFKIGDSSPYGSPNHYRVPFDGYLSDVRIYNRALSSNEVAQLYALEAPVPPVITLQPQSVAAVAGSSTNLSVTATGIQLLTYQWMKDGVALPGATNATLLFSNLQPVNVGDYVAVVSNGGGSVTSSVASVSIPGVNSGLWQGLVAYYPFNGNANDESGNGNSWVLTSDFYSGADRYGVLNKSFDCFSKGVVSAQNEGGTNPVSITFWFKGTVFKDYAGIWPAYNGEYTRPFGGFAGMGAILRPDGVLILGAGDSLHIYQLTATTNWQMISINYLGSMNTCQVYQNGQLQAKLGSMYYSDALLPNSPLLSMGGFNIDRAENSLDDVRIYNRALSSNEVAQLHALEAPVPPSITLQPQSLVAASGSVTNLIVGATGSDALRYQWLKDGVILPGATNATLAFTNLQPVNVGDYVAVVSNGGGSVTSSVASVSIPGVNSGLWQGLVAYYPFNGNANDESGFGNDGTVNGAAISADRFRNPISAYTFAGSQNIAFGAVPLQQIDDWTLCGWISASSLNQTSMAITVGHDDGMTGDGFELGISDGTSLPGNKLYGILGGVEVLDSGYAISSVQQWHHVAMIRSGGVTRFYMDGVQTANTSSAVPRRPTAFSIGSGTGIRFFEGQIDDVRIYNRALSSNDVAALYQLETAAPVFVTQPATVTHQIGDAVILSVQSAGGQPTTYTWHFSGAVVNSITNSSLTIASLQAVHLGAYTVVASNQWGMATSSVATVYCPASITAPPMSVVSPLGGQALFLVEAAGYDLPTYQWMFNGTNLPNATASSLAVTNVQLRNAGSYAVVVSNSLGRVTSSVAWLSVSPSLYTPFVGATPIWGRSASIGVSAVGSGQLNFQWYLNGVAIDGATAPSINFPSIQFTNAGMYSVVISSAYGIVTNAAAEVSVNPAEVDLAFYPGLTINGHTGNRYTIQSSSDLSNTNNWITQTNLMLEMDTQLWFDSSVKASDPNNTQYFYRVLPEN